MSSLQNAKTTTKSMPSSLLVVKKPLQLVLISKKWQNSNILTPLLLTLFLTGSISNKSESQSLLQSMVSLQVVDVYHKLYAFSFSYIYIHIYIYIFFSPHISLILKNNVLLASQFFFLPFLFYLLNFRYFKQTKYYNTIKTKNCIHLY